MQDIKVVINTHPSYKFCLDTLMQSLKYTDHPTDIIVCISDVQPDLSSVIRQEYADLYGLPIQHVLTTDRNIDEYSAFIALGEALRTGQVSPEDRFLMLHDTCEAGRLFWNKLEEIKQRIAVVTSGNPCYSTKFELDAHQEKYGNVYKISDDQEPLKMIVTLNETKDKVAACFRRFVYNSKQKRLETICRVPDGPDTQTIVGYIDHDCNVTTDESQAVLIEPHEKENQGINETLLQKCKKYLWLPVSGNFNLGIATAEFIQNHAAPAFSAVHSLTKTESIDVEINEDNPLNLHRLATIDGIPRWRYVYAMEITPRQCRFPTMSLWLNDTDVYSNGKLRNISYLHTLDLKKYSCLVGKLWNATHDTR